MILILRNSNEFAREKCELFDKWCTSNRVTDFQALRKLIPLEEFKSCISDRIMVYLNEQKVTFLSQASVCADKFILTHRNIFTPVSGCPRLPLDD